MDGQVDQKRMKPATASGQRSIPLNHDQSDSEEEQEYSFEPEQLEFVQLSTIYSHPPSRIPVIVSCSKLPQPVQAHEKDSVTSPNFNT